MKPNLYIEIALRLLISGLMTIASAVVVGTALSLIEYI